MKEIIKKLNPLSGKQSIVSDSRDVLISLLIPIYNEEQNLPILFNQIFSFMDSLDLTYEVIAINDGSTDTSGEFLKNFALIQNKLRVINFRRNYGQTAAMMAGFDFSLGSILITIDADLQNDITDLPKLIAKIDEGYDVVSGWRQQRKDAAIRRNFVSRIANRIISYVSGVPLHDYGCTLKAYKRDIIENVKLYGEMHRFIPIYAYWEGAVVGEVPVKHHPRRFGKSNYGLERSFKVILDLIVVKFLHRYQTKPIYVFGGFGILSFIVSFSSFILMLYMKVFLGVSMILTPLPLLVAITMLVGVLSILMGLLAEIMVRTYFESQGRSPYSVSNTINIKQLL